MKNKKEVRKLTKTGRSSLYVILPKEMLSELGWKERQKLVIKRVRGGFFIADYPSKK